MAIYKTIVSGKGMPLKMRIDGHIYHYQCGHAFLEDAESTAVRFRRQGLFARIIKHQKPGHPSRLPYGSYRPSYSIYVRPMRTRKPPEWFNWGR